MEKTQPSTGQKRLAVLMRSAAVGTWSALVRIEDKAWSGVGRDAEIALDEVMQKVRIDTVQGAEAAQTELTRCKALAACLPQKNGENPYDTI